MKASYQDFQTGVVIKAKNGIIKVNGVIVGEYNVNIKEAEFIKLINYIITNYK